MQEWLFRPRDGDLRFKGQEVHFLTLDDGTDTLSRNVGKALLLDAALNLRTAQISSASRRKPEIMGITVYIRRIRKQD
jgi:hypothetical protein